MAANLNIDCPVKKMDLCPQSKLDECCLKASNDLANSIKDNFESESVSEDNWSVIQGGEVGGGCGQLFSHAYGDSLYFNGCKMRQAISKPLDLSKASSRKQNYNMNSSRQSGLCHYYSRKKRTLPNFTY
ncbi:Reelin [Bagarius yarrelli]|uniref:Reelin n=1 Tax=Bagarius yarrelli TaxID=175774 RepID=A0A556VB26_BAGYA|nr:Reelin [Bagarius yarrelli]